MLTDEHTTLRTGHAAMSAAICRCACLRYSQGVPKGRMTMQTCLLVHAVAHGFAPS